MNLQTEIEILRSNCAEFSARGEIAARQREICLAELIDRVTADPSEAEGETLYRRFTQALPEATHDDKAVFCHCLSLLPSSEERLLEQSSYGGGEPTAPGSHGRIALVRNRYNEEAFELFSYAVLGAKPLYAPSFSDACEDVLDNRAEFCILPVENTEDGRLFGFYAMLDRYELRICAACDLETEDRVGSVRYALVGRTRPPRLPKKAAWQMEFSVAAPIGEFPLAITQVARRFEAKLMKLDSLPVLYDDGLGRFYFTFLLPRREAPCYDLYLSMEYPRYTPIGLYPILNTH